MKTQESMKRQKSILHKMTLAMFVLLAVGIGHAQEGIKTKIPFSFNVGAQEFPAGEYTLTPEPLGQHSMLLLRNQSGQVLASAPTDSEKSPGAPSSTKLVFHQYGGQYFLAQLWQAGTETGQQLVPSPSETMAKANNSPRQESH